MNKIQSFELSSFQIHELAAYCAEVEGFAVQNLVQDYAELYADFSKALIQLRMQWANAAETLANSIDEADTAADQAWNAIYAQLKINLNHYRKDVREAAQETMKVFNLVNNPTRLPYNEEYEQLEILIHHLDQISIETRRLAMVDGWIKELQSRVAIFKELQSANAQDDCEFETGATKKARLTLVDAYHHVIDKINAMTDTNSDPNLQTFIQKMNEFISDHLLMQKIKQTIAARS
ncbi:MAG: hypothetical protein J6S69_08210 [Proteobacteria bacterium]|nr:hypothetical protein [Pseudomonadota bacterium]